MYKVSVATLKANLAHYLDRMRAGESFVITVHGRSVAVLEPLGWDLDSDETLRALVLEGLASPPTAKLGDDFFARPNMQRRPRTGCSSRGRSPD